MRNAVVLIVVVLAGCKGSSATCEESAQRIEQALGPTMSARSGNAAGAMLHDIVVERCGKDDWSAAARDCTAKVSSIAEVAGCRDALGSAAMPLSVAIRAAIHQLEGAPREATATAPPPVTPPTTADSLVVEVTATGIVAGGKPVTDDELDKLFRAAFARSPATQVVIKTAHDTPHAHVVQIMERAKAAGLTRLAIGSLP